MTDKPILFSGPMVRAILEGRKTMTRRVVTRQTSDCCVWIWKHLEFDAAAAPHDAPGMLVDGTPSDGMYLHVPCRPDHDDPLDDWTRWRVGCRFVPGDRLWLRETFCPLERCDWIGINPKENVNYKADANRDTESLRKEMGYAWRPSIHMPRWASRITLAVTAVRVERLQEITEEDAIAEGFIKLPATGRAVLVRGAQYAGNCWPSARAGFRELWDSLNAKRGFPWDSNPWVWVISFKRVEEEA